MNVYEIIKPSGEIVRIAASGWSWDHGNDRIVFYDAGSNAVATFKSGEWAELHMRTPLATAAA